jgi:hypothetical protein
MHASDRLIDGQFYPVSISFDLVSGFPIVIRYSFRLRCRFFISLLRYMVRQQDDGIEGL